MKKNKKQKIDPRHLKRKKALKSLFSYSYNELAKRKSTLPKNKLAEKVIAKIDKINEVITSAAPKWPLAKINKVDLSILRLAVWELFYRQKVPPKVVINEAIELAKEYGGENSSSFVNGVLGTVYKDFIEKKENEEKSGKTTEKTKN